MHRQLFFCLVTATFAAWQVAICNVSPADDYESAAYTVVKTDGQFEVRDYPDLMLVLTATEINAQGRDGSFMKLFRYISGENESRQKIAMTTPVFMEKGAAESKMGFVVPKQVAIAGTPQPSGEGVVVQKRRGGRFAVIRFPGRLNEKLAETNESKLRQWMAANELQPAKLNDGDAVDADSESASYDAPFTPGPMRRNEVLIRIDAE